MLVMLMPLRGGQVLGEQCSIADGVLMEFGYHSYYLQVHLVGKGKAFWAWRSKYMWWLTKFMIEHAD